MSRTDRLGWVILCAGLILFARGALEWAFVNKAEAQGVANCSSANASCRVATITTTTATGTGAATFAQYIATGTGKALEINRNAWIQLDGPGYTAVCGLASSGSCVTSTSNNFAHYTGTLRTHSTNGTGFVDFPQGILINNKLAYSATAPTISSGFGTSPSVTAGTATSFRVNVGTGGTATNGVIALPTATNGWNCTCADITTKSSTVYLCKQTADSTTTATIGNFDAAGAAAAWAASDILAVNCTGF